MLQEKLQGYIEEPNCGLRNFELALEYDRIGQLASAVSFYIRAAEKSKNTEIVYNSLILAASCFERQNRRKFTVEGLLQHAISIFPTRPEAHFHLCRLYEQMSKWREIVVHSSIGLASGQTDKNMLLSYPNHHGLLFYNALGNYQIGLFEDAKLKFLRLAYLEPDVDILYKTLSKNNISNVGYPDIIPYKKEMEPLFKFPFEGLETIEHNYSKHYQDMFVLAVLDGKRNGYYIEIGAGCPYETNNTALLEDSFAWKGISFDNNSTRCYEFADQRSNTIVCKDMLNSDLKQIFDEHCIPEFVDYLQIDCDEASLETLYKIPFDDHTFGVIQFEHDIYRLNSSIKQKATDFLISKGYIKLVNNIAFNEKDCYEDWWVHPSLYRKEMESLSEHNFVLTYMLKVS